MSGGGDPAPRSPREVWALVALALLFWIAVLLAARGPGIWTDGAIALAGAAGALGILGGGLAWTIRLRRR
jgi:hypothetical protein